MNNKEYDGGDEVIFRVLMICLLSVSTAWAHDDVLKMPSKHSVSETLDRLQKTVESKGMSVFVRVDHVANAKTVGLDMRPQQLLIFGNPKIGTKLMHCEPAMGLDLPIRVAAWEKAGGDVMVAYNMPEFLKKKHHVKGCDALFDKMSKALFKMVKGAAN